MIARAPKPYSIRFDENAGVLRVTHGEFMTNEVFERYRADLARGVAEARAATPALRALFDNHAMCAVNAEVGARIASLAPLFIAEDRIALIVQSSLLKLELRRVAHAPEVQCFLSSNAAMTWLMAYATSNVSAA